LIIRRWSNTCCEYIRSSFLSTFKPNAALMNLRIILFIAAISFTSCTTRYYLVRHAEKACEDCIACGLKDPEGIVRANTLADTLARIGIDHVYASQCQRTQKTAEPSAIQAGKPVEIYHTDQLTGFIEMLANYNDNREILIVGHSNQVPVMIDSLAHQQVTIGPDDYDNLFIITKRRFIRTWTTLESRTYGVMTQ